tara:strand:- start:114 stop:281 length:168 start_codon:yes stop_codon:yes gene_type:complete
MNEKIMIYKEAKNEKIAKILCKIEDHLDNLQEQNKIECFDKVNITEMLDEINELI